jgi:hypothetical protein
MKQHSTYLDRLTKSSHGYEDWRIPTHEGNSSIPNVWCKLMHYRVIGLFCFDEQTVTATMYHDMLEDSSAERPPANSHLPAGCCSTPWVSDSERISGQSISKLLDWSKRSLAHMARVGL